MKWKKYRQIKYEILGCIVLPVFLVILGIKVLRTYIQIRMRRIAGGSQTA